MTNEPTPARYFEQFVLVDPDTGKTVIERRYCDGIIEYWSVLNLGYQNAAGQTGTAQVPFKIEIPDTITISDEEYAKAGHNSHTGFCRAAAFANFDDAMKAAEPAAKEKVNEQFRLEAKKQQSKIILSGALPKSPVIPMN